MSITIVSFYKKLVYFIPFILQQTACSTTKQKAPWEKGAGSKSNIKRINHLHFLTHILKYN